MRRGEILGLQWREIDNSSRTAFIPAEKAKGKRDRWVYLNSVALGILKEIGEPEDKDTLVFGNSAAHHQGNLERLWRKALKAAKVTDFRFHDLRHTFASRVLRAGRSLAEVKDLLGVKDYQTTLRYARLVATDFHNAVAALEPDLQNTCINNESRPKAAS